MFLNIHLETKMRFVILFKTSPTDGSEDLQTRRESQELIDMMKIIDPGSITKNNFISMKLYKPVFHSDLVNFFQLLKYYSCVHRIYCYSGKNQGAVNIANTTPMTMVSEIEREFNHDTGRTPDIEDLGFSGFSGEPGSPEK